MYPFLATVRMPLQDDIVREAQTMRRLHHPNVLLLHVSFVHKQMLWMVEPYIAGGSMLNIMKYAYPEASSSTAGSMLRPSVPMEQSTFVALPAVCHGSFIHPWLLLCRA